LLHRFYFKTKKYLFEKERGIISLKLFFLELNIIFVEYKEAAKTFKPKFSGT